MPPTTATKQTDNKPEDQADEETVSDLQKALAKVTADTTVDEGTLDEFSMALRRMNRATRQKVLDLPEFARLIDQFADKAPLDVKAGEYVQVGELSSYKKPWSLDDIFAGGVVETYTARETIPVTFEGWTFMLHEGVVYDTPGGTPPDQLKENHGYQLPGAVIGILTDRYEALRKARIDTETKEFGQGVRFIQTGWPGKDTVIGEPVE